MKNNETFKYQVLGEDYDYDDLKDRPEVLEISKENIKCHGGREREFFNVVTVVPVDDWW